MQVGADGRFSDRFDVYGSHIYITDLAFAKSELLSEVHKQIDEANAARKRPGNIAFEDSGVKLRVSSQAKYQPTPIRLVDGVRDGAAASVLAASFSMGATACDPANAGGVANSSAEIVRTDWMIFMVILSACHRLN